jgi:hypothetical protein
VSVSNSDESLVDGEARNHEFICPTTPWKNCVATIYSSVLTPPHLSSFEKWKLAEKDRLKQIASLPRASLRLSIKS